MYKGKYFKYKNKYVEVKREKNEDFNYSDKDIKKWKTIFIQNIFNILKKYDVCFIYGAIIFQDNNNLLFNLLTYYKLSIIECLLDIGRDDIKKPVIHYTYTHKDIFNLPHVKPDKCLQLNTINKLELNIDNLSYICDKNTPKDKRNKKDKVTKRILLYYKFKYNNETYLFFKLEPYGMNHILHTVELLKTLIGTIKPTSYNIRDEYKNTEVNYTNFYEKDMNFYKKFSEDNGLKFNKNIIEKYNMFLRTGNEIYIPEDIKNKIITSFYDIKLEDLKE